MKTPTETSQLRFFCEEPFKRFARIEGIATLDDDGITFEYAMTQSVAPTPKGTVTKRLSWKDIAGVELRHHWISTSKLRFRAKSLKAIESYPTTDPGAFEVELLETPKEEAEAFVELAKLRCGLGE